MQLNRAAAIAVIAGVAVWIASGLFDTAKADDPWRKPFSDGGALSMGDPLKKGGPIDIRIDKPFDKGGLLSIDKPFSKGGALSIHKVYVPTKLRIGKVQTIQEVLIPVCWGSPQDCRDKPNNKTGGTTWKPEAEYPYMVVARFTCMDRTTNRVSTLKPDCDLITRSQRSCAEALGALDVLVEEIWQEGYDACAKCLETRNPTLYWDGKKPQHIQDGACRGQ